MDKILLINDLEAISYGLALLSEEEIHTLSPGTPDIVGGQAVIAPGTGLGEAILFLNKKELFPYATEGGHCDFSPTNELQIKLLEFLRKKYKHVSWERILSSSGIFNIYEFLIQSENMKESAHIAKELLVTDPAIVITQSALKGEDEVCEKTIELFLDLLGLEAGNLALKSLARGGIYIGGGIVPRLIKIINRDKFFKAFTNKGRLSEMLGDIPIHIILSDDVGMRGAARCAMLNFQVAK